MKHKILTILILIPGIFTSCNIFKKSDHTIVYNTEFPPFSYEGHRGARGLFPENSIGAMKVAIDIPTVTTLELDCHITKDKQVIVYHDDFLNPKFVTYRDGSELEKKDSKKNIYKYNYAELSQFDLGMKGNIDFPKQLKIATPIPLLSKLVDESEIYIQEKRKKPMFYNIEIKSNEANDHKAHPSPQEFVDLVVEVLIDKKILSRTVLQSFDKRAIQYINTTYPQVRTSYLIEYKNKKTIVELIEDLGFKPFIISPNYKLVTEEYVLQAHSLGIKIIPWTVNSKEDIQQLKQLQVDGVISDYPNLFE